MKDPIEREDAIKVTWQEPSYTDAINILTEVREKIKNIPSVEKQGKWIDKGVDYDGTWYYQCSECSASVENVEYPHCPYCLARMKGAVDETI